MTTASTSYGSSVEPTRITRSPAPSHDLANASAEAGTISRRGLVAESKRIPALGADDVEERVANRTKRADGSGVELLVAQGTTGLDESQVRPLVLSIEV